MISGIPEDKADSKICIWKTTYNGGDGPSLGVSSCTKKEEPFTGGDYCHHCGGWIVDHDQ